MKRLRATFGSWRLVDVTADDVEQYLRARLKKRALVKTKGGFRELGILKTTTVHQEFRVLRRALNVAVPTALRDLVEQQMIEFHAPAHLRNVVRIITGKCWDLDS